MENNKSKKIIIIVVGILVLLVALVTATYAWFSARSNSEEKNITTAKEELIVTPTKDSIHVENIKPTSVTSRSIKDDPFLPDTEATDENNKNEDVVQIPISVTNKSTININYNLTIKTDNLNLTEGLNGGTTEDIKWVLFKLPSENGSSSDAVGFGDFYNPDVEQNMVENIEIKPNEKHYYTLYVYIQEMEEDQNRLQDIEFDVIINGNTTKKEKVPVGEKLSDVILKNNIIKDREPNYKTVKCYDEYSDCLTDSGLYKLENDKGYLFRNIFLSTNVVYFGRFKENDILYNLNGTYNELPISWDVLRINEDGSVVLILKSAPGIRYKWETVSGKPDYEGSSIQEVINDWYDDTFTAKEKEMIKTTTYCNDRSDNYEGVSKRLNKEIPEPTLNCEDKDKVTANIALPTADELVMTGYYYVNKLLIHSSHNDYRIFNYGALTMSPASQNEVYLMDCDHLYPFDLSSIYNIYDSTVRPVITLKPDVTISESVTWNDQIYRTTTFGNLRKVFIVGYDE